jgi:hypothetical protein
MPEPVKKVLEPVDILTELRIQSVVCAFRQVSTSPFFWRLVLFGKKGDTRLEMLKG